MIVTKRLGFNEQACWLCSTLKSSRGPKAQHNKHQELWTKFAAAERLVVSTTNIDA